MFGCQFYEISCESVVKLLCSLMSRSRCQVSVSVKSLSVSVSVSSRYQSFSVNVSHVLLSLPQLSQGMIVYHCPSQVTVKISQCIQSVSVSHQSSQFQSFQDQCFNQLIVV